MICGWTMCLGDTLRPTSFALTGTLPISFVRECPCTEFSVTQASPYTYTISYLIIFYILIYYTKTSQKFAL